MKVSSWKMGKCQRTSDIDGGALEAINQQLGGTGVDIVGIKGQCQFGTSGRDNNGGGCRGQMVKEHGFERHAHCDGDHVPMSRLQKHQVGKRTVQ